MQILPILAIGGWNLVGEMVRKKKFLFRVAFRKTLTQQGLLPQPPIYGATLRFCFARQNGSAKGIGGCRGVPSAFFGKKKLANFDHFFDQICYQNH